MVEKTEEFSSWLHENGICLNVRYSLCDYIYAISSFLRTRISGVEDIFEVISEDNFKELYYLQNHYYYKKANKKNNGAHDEIVFQLFNFMGKNIIEYDKYYNQRIGSDKLPSSILYIHKGHIVCFRHKHPIECVNATIYGGNKEVITINANSCIICNKLFISNSYFEQLKYKHKWILGNFQFVDKEGRFSSPLTSFAEESPLKICGYNVKSVDLTEEKRHLILSRIIDSGVLTKTEVINYLERFITLNGSRPSLALARIKWQSDLDFVNQYSSEHQKNFYVKDIQRYKR